MPLTFYRYLPDGKRVKCTEHLIRIVKKTGNLVCLFCGVDKRDIEIHQRAYEDVKEQGR